jgi:Tol biopolymer transport system component
LLVILLLTLFEVSPDGQSVVFERARQFNDQHSDLWVMRLDGRDARLLVRDGSGPSWSR